MLTSYPTISNSLYDATLDRGSQSDELVPFQMRSQGTSPAEKTALVARAEVATTEIGKDRNEKGACKKVPFPLASLQQTSSLCRAFNKEFLYEISFTGRFDISGGRRPTWFAFATDRVIHVCNQHL